MFRGLAKIQMLGDGTKDLQAEVFQLGHVMIMHGNGPAIVSIVVEPESRRIRKQSVCQASVPGIRGGSSGGT